MQFSKVFFIEVIFAPFIEVNVTETKDSTPLNIKSIFISSCSLKVTKLPFFSKKIEVLYGTGLSPTTI